MTDVSKTMLCIGGPLAGPRYASRSGVGFSVPVMPPENQGDLTNLDRAPTEPVSFEIVGYREETFHTPQADISFWVPRDQTPLQTMELLMRGYVVATARRPE